MKKQELSKFMIISLILTSLLSLIQQWYICEKLDASHLQRLKG